MVRYSDSARFKYSVNPITRVFLLWSKYTDFMNDVKSVFSADNIMSFRSPTRSVGSTVQFWRSITAPLR